MGLKTSIYLDAASLARIEFLRSQGWDDETLSSIVRHALAELVPEIRHLHFRHAEWKCPDCGWTMEEVK